MEEIKQWLSNPTGFDAGLRLYAAHGKNMTMHRHIKDSRDMQLLKQMLTRLVGGIDLKKLEQKLDDSLSRETCESLTQFIIDKRKKTVTHEITSQQNQTVTDRNVLIDNLHREKQHIGNARGKLSNSLRSFAKNDNAGRAAVVKEINKHTAQINKIREQIKYVEEHGVLQVEAPVEEEKEKFSIPEGDGDRVKLLISLRQKRSKAKARRDGLERNTKAWTRQDVKYQQHDNEIKELESFLRK